MERNGNRRGALFLHASDKKEAMRDCQQSSRPNLKADKSSQNSQLVKRPLSTQPSQNSSSDEFNVAHLSSPFTLPEMHPMTSSSTPARRGARRNSLAVTTFSVPPYSPTGGAGRRLSTKPSSSPTIKEKSSENEPALTNQQVLAFREVFDLFDSNGGGTIDAEELEGALRSVDIHVSKEEIIESGEIDFTEFLTLMTNTEKFLEIFANKNDSGDALKKSFEGRETVLFDALTQFMKSSALAQMDEIVGYYNTKYKRAQAPHVVMHYAAGARLIGLTEKQLTEHLKKIQMSNSGNMTNPYAQPLYNVFFTPRKKTKKKKKNPQIKQAPVSKESFERPRYTGKIRLKVCIRSLGQSETTSKSQNQSKNPGKRQTQTGESAAGKEIDFKAKLAWTTSRVRSITKKLPAENRELTTEDLPYIREKIQAATREYFRESSEKKHQENLQYWKRIGPQHIPSKTLRGNFHRCFRAYIAAGLRKTK
ncbi:hypothetical protein BSL78_22198 [Apostichopus japonicus]|uniref:EF-hand domain-containing protein n=1 Tax=Stichopus japonicus TaxID=307972 RepID=A0A2G8JYY6_STIJA|nr:hypothetical protein BSL78_22198 [Apostichopus japonicus]